MSTSGNMEDRMSLVVERRRHASHQVLEKVTNFRKFLQGMKEFLLHVL
jgi:hypothetical protein